MDNESNGDRITGLKQSTLRGAAERHTVQEGVATERLTAALAEQVMGWSVGPDRFMMGNRRWMPRWRFAPLTNLIDAFDLLDASASAYTLATNGGGTFEAEVRVGGRIGKAAGAPRAWTITIALARALGLELPDDGSDSMPVSPRRRNP